MIVALFVEQNDGKELRQGGLLNERVREILSKAGLHSDLGPGESGRSPGAVKRKSSNLITAIPGYAGRVTKGGAETAAVATYWHDDPDSARTDAAAIVELIEQGSYSATEVLLYGQWEAKEGAAVLARHLRRERNPRLREIKIKSSANLDCEVCGLNYGRMYGERGLGYIEVHHIVPLHVSGATVSKIDDLALLCSNCHRMAHRKPWVTPAVLRRQVQFDFHDVLPGHKTIVRYDD